MSNEVDSTGEGEDIPRTAQHVLECMNRWFAADPNAMHALVCNRVPCNEALGSEPDILVDCFWKPTGDDGDRKACFPVVGMLGVVNGLLAGTEYALALVLDDGIPAGFTLRHYSTLTFHREAEEPPLQ